MIFADETGAIMSNLFVKPDQYQKFHDKLVVNNYYLVQAEIYYDNRYSQDLEAKVVFIAEDRAPEKRKDLALSKRIELHCHSRMSAQDAIPAAEDIVKMAHSFGHEAVAITDHGVVQSFPEAYLCAKKLSKEKEIKLIFGMEGYMIDDGPTIVYGLRPFPEEKPTSFVAFDIETTGLDNAKDRIIEIGAVLFEKNNLTGDFEAIKSFNRLINPHCKLSQKIIDLTGITDEMLEAEGIETRQAMEEFETFVDNRLLVAHNALFDLGFIRQEGYRTEKQEDIKIKFNMRF